MPKLLQRNGQFVLDAGGTAPIAAPGSAEPPPQVFVVAASPVVNVIEGASAVIRISRDIVDTDPLTFDYATVDGTALAGVDYTATSGASAIAGGELYVDITVPTIERVGAQDPRSFTFTISGAVIDGGVVEITNPSSTITVSDTSVEEPALPVLAVTAFSTNILEGNPLTFRVSTSYVYPTDITFTYTTSDGTAVASVDYTAIGGTGTIPALATSVDFNVLTPAIVGYQGARTVVFTISGAASAGDALTIVTSTATGTIIDSEAPTGDNAHFEAMIARPDYYVGYSLRPIAGRPKYYLSGPHVDKPDPYYGLQLERQNVGGYRRNSIGFNETTYNPGADTHPQAQDATKTAIYPWTGNPVLKSDVDASSPVLHIQGTSFPNRKGMRCEDEAFSVRTARDGGADPVSDGDGGTYVTVYRGFRGTTAAAHAAGAIVPSAKNSLSSSSRLDLPLGTYDGHTYLWEVDVFFTGDSEAVTAAGLGYINCGLSNNKFYQFEQTDVIDDRWLETQTRFNPSTAYMPPDYNPATDVCVITHRYYSGANITTTDWATAQIGKADQARGYISGSQDPLRFPSGLGLITNGGYCVKAGVWTRFSWFLEQQANDWDYVTLWAADENRDPVRVYDRIRLSIAPQVSGIGLRQWWIEMNTSEEGFVRSFDGSPADTPDLVTYHKNYVMLEDPGATPEDVESLLERPT